MASCPLHHPHDTEHDAQLVAAAVCDATYPLIAMRALQLHQCAHMAQPTCSCVQRLSFGCSTLDMWLGGGVLAVGLAMGFEHVRSC